MKEGKKKEKLLPTYNLVVSVLYSCINVLKNVTQDNCIFLLLLDVKSVVTGWVPCSIYNQTERKLSNPQT